MSEALWSLFEVAVNIYQGFIVLYFVCSCLDFDFKNPSNKSVYITGSLILAVVVTIINYLTFYEGVLGFIYPVFVFVFTCLFIKGRVIKKLFVTFLAFMCMIGVSNLVVSAASTMTQSELENIYSQDNTTRFVVIIIVQLLLAYVYQLILSVIKKDEFMLNIKEWLLILTTLFTSITIFALVHSAQLSNSEHILSELVLAVINILCFYTIINISKSNKVRTENALLKQQNEYRKNYADNIRKQYDEMRRLRHDIKQSYSVITALAAQEKYDKLNEYLLELVRQIDVTESSVNTDNDIVNAILNSKLSLAKNLKIQTLCSTINDFSGIEDIDLCNLLGNLLDNAVEACCRHTETEEKYLEIIISIDKNIITITIKNTYNTGDLANNPNMTTTKRNRNEAHGFGIRTIKNIAEKYNGKAEFYIEDDLFCTCITLYI